MKLDSRFAWALATAALAVQAAGCRSAGAPAVHVVRPAADAAGVNTHDLADGQSERGAATTPAGDSAELIIPAAQSVLAVNAPLPASEAAINADPNVVEAVTLVLPASQGLVASIEPLPPFEPLVAVDAAAFQSSDAEEIATPSLPQGTVLELEPLVAEVVARNPDIRAAAAAWRAAAARYPQEISLDDPMFGFMLGPDSWGSNEVDSAYALEASQKVPWFGKRQLRGNRAQAEANAAYHDVGEERLRIAEATRLAYYEYYFVHRQQSVLASSNELLNSFREIAQSKYEAAEVEQQDVLLADVELAELARRQLELTRMARVARARINTLLLLPPETPLPDPPDKLAASEQTASLEELRAMALAQRPELAAQAARIRAERYAVALACKEFYPDMEFVARYDAFWQVPEDELRPMIGMNLNVPLYKQKRWAAVSEARARVAKEQADFDSRVAELAFEVDQAYQRLEESRLTLAVYEDRLLPAVTQSVDSARASYVTGGLDFLRLVESQRQSLDTQESYYEAMTEFHRRGAELDRVIGFAPPVLSAAAE